MARVHARTQDPACTAVQVYNAKSSRFRVKPVQLAANARADAAPSGHAAGCRQQGRDLSCEEQRLAAVVVAAFAAAERHEHANVVLQGGGCDGSPAPKRTDKECRQHLVPFARRRRALTSTKSRSRFYVQPIVFICFFTPHRSGLSMKPDSAAFG